jgi:hypothetical protein
MKYELISRTFSARAAILGFVRRTNEAAGDPRQDSLNPGRGLKRLQNTKYKLYPYFQYIVQYLLYSGEPTGSEIIMTIVIKNLVE